MRELHKTPGWGSWGRMKGCGSRSTLPSRQATLVPPRRVSEPRLPESDIEILGILVIRPESLTLVILQCKRRFYYPGDVLTGS